MVPSGPPGEERDTKYINLERELQIRKVYVSSVKVFLKDGKIEEIYVFNELGELYTLFFEYSEYESAYIELYEKYIQTIEFYGD